MVHVAEPLRRRDPQALAQAESKRGRAVAIERVLQFAFAQQWEQLRDAAEENGIRILGDVAIFVNMDSLTCGFIPESSSSTTTSIPSASQACRPTIFPPLASAGATPSIAGMCWPRPTRTDFDSIGGSTAIRRAVELYDIVRLDHFRGFEAYWAIPAEEETAVKGEWIKAPGLELFRALEAALGPLPLVAEDLGLITPEVEALRKELAMPGMKVLQFGFSDKGAHTHLPQQFTTSTVAYTGRTTTTRRRVGGIPRAKWSVRLSRPWLDR